MRSVMGGNGQDTTTATLAFLAANSSIYLQTLYLIGYPGDPFSIMLTDYQSPLVWSPYGTFKGPTVISRGKVSSKYGLETQSLDLTWTPKAQAFTNNVATTSPLQLAQFGYYDNWPVYVWTVYMPTPGDANTLGASPLFGGRIASSTVDRGKIKFSVNSFLDILQKQQTPTNVIEASNQLASYTGATPPTGFTNVPSFSVFTGSTPNVLYGDVLPPFTSGHLFTTHVFVRGFVYFLHSPGSTLGGFWSPVGDNSTFTDGIGGTHNQINIYNPVPWAPTPWSGTAGDQFVVSAASPINQADGDYFGFPYVPAPQVGGT